FENEQFARLLARLRGTQTIVMPRTDQQRAELASAGGLIVPERPIDAQSLIAYADLVVRAAGTMNREAVALGTPVYTLFEGRLGAVDERLIAEGRLRRLERADQVELVKRKSTDAAAGLVRRDPGGEPARALGVSSDPIGEPAPAKRLVLSLPVSDIAVQHPPAGPQPDAGS